MNLHKNWYRAVSLNLQFLIIVTFTSSGMNCTLEKVLADAKSLVERLRNHDNAAEMLIEQTTSLNKRVEAMKQVGGCTNMNNDWLVDHCSFYRCFYIHDSYRQIVIKNDTFWK